MAAIRAPLEGLTSDAQVSRATSPRPQRVEVIAITGDDALLEQVGKVLDGESTVRHADGPDEAQELLRPAQPSVVLLDARGHDDLDRLVQGLHSLEGSRVVIVFAPAGQTEDVARSVRGSAAFAVLAIPVEEPQARAVIEGACEEVLARQALLVAPAPAPTPAPAPIPPPVSAPMVRKPSTVAAAPVEDKAPRTDTRPHKAVTSSSRFGRKPLVIAVGGALLTAALVVSWLSMPSPQPAVAPTTTPAAAAPVASSAPIPLAQGSVDDLLDAARTAMRERRYTDPETNSALHFYSSALAREPGNGEAREGLLRIGAVLRERLQAALDDHHVDEAARTLAQLRSVTPGDPTLASLEASVTEARVARAIDAGEIPRATDLLRQAEKSGALPSDRVARWQAELARRQSNAQAAQFAQLVSLRIRQGKLVEPTGDSARYFLGQLRQLPATSQDLAGSASREYQQACLSRLRDAIAKGQRADVERWKTEARAAGVGAAELAYVQREASTRAMAQEADREITRVAQLVQDRIANGRLLEPADDSAMFHFTNLRRLDSSGGVAGAAGQSLSIKLLDSGRAALAGRQFDTARTYASAARQLGSNLDAVAALERDVAAAGASGAVAAAAPLVRTRFVAPAYPKEALEQHLKGDVRLQITVEAEGKVKDAVVVQSNLPKAFDQAAVDAARRWRFKPIAEKGSGVERTASVTIVFQPEAAQP